MDLKHFECFNNLYICIYPTSITNVCCTALSSSIEMTASVMHSTAGRAGHSLLLLHHSFSSPQGSTTSHTLPNSFSQMARSHPKAASLCFQWRAHKAWGHGWAGLLLEHRMNLITPFSWNTNSHPS